MKAILAAAVALVLGLFLGGLGPRSQLRRMERELAEVRVAAENAGSRSAAPAVLGGLLGLGSRPVTAPGSPPPPRFTPPPPEPEPDQPPELRRVRPDGGARLRGENFREGFEKMRTAMDLRATQFRAAFFEQARMPAEKERQVEGLIARMNQELTTQAEEAWKTLKAKPGRLGPRDMVNVGVKLMTVYQKADDELQSVLDPQARAAVESTGFDLLTQLDVSGFRGLMEEVDRFELNGRGPREPR